VSVEFTHGSQGVNRLPSLHMKWIRTVRDRVRTLGVG